MYCVLLLILKIHVFDLIVETRDMQIRKSAEMSEASLLIGGYAAIVNLMDIKKRFWSNAALNVCL